MDLYNVFNQILIIFLILIVGFAAKKLKAVSDGFCKDLAGFVSNIALPALIIGSLNYEFSQDRLNMSIRLFIISIIIYGLSILLAYILPSVLKIESSKKGIFMFMTVFSNVGFMGYPVANAIYGSEGVFYTAVFVLTFNILVWTVGVAMIKNGRDKNALTLKSVINPGTVAVLIGFSIFIFSIKVPMPIASVLDMIGSMTTPLSMFYIGAMLAGASIKQLFSSPIVFEMSIIRLILLPLLFLLILKPFVSQKMLLGLSIIMTAMPAAANTAIFAGLYDGDIYTASQSVFISTLLSVATIPVIAYLLNAMLY